MKTIILSSIFLIVSSKIFGVNDFACSKIYNKGVLSYGAMYGAFYSLGYNDARNNKIDNEFEVILLSSMNLRIIAASIPIVSATSFEKERSFDFT